MSKYINLDPSILQGTRYRKGKGGGGGSSINADVMNLAQQGTFKPYTLSTSAGGSSANGAGDFEAYSSEGFNQLQNQSLYGANEFLPQLSEAVGRGPAEFKFNSDLDLAQKNLFDQQSSLLQPQFAQQNQQLKNDLFGSGRMGLSLAGSAVGAGGDGFANPDAFGLAQSQNQTMANLAASTRQQALGEQQQQFGIEAGQFGVNQDQQQQYINNLSQGSQGLFGMAQGISAQELAMLQAGQQGEALRGQSFTNAATALAAGKSEKKEGGGKGLIGQIGAAAITKSDVRLKDDITQVGILPNGLGVYTWTWNKIAKGLGIDTPELGVLAQEVLEVLPSAVSLGEDGYYEVNYSEVLNGTI